MLLSRRNVFHLTTQAAAMVTTRGAGAAAKVVAVPSSAPLSAAASIARLTVANHRIYLGISQILCRIPTEISSFEALGRYEPAGGRRYRHPDRHDILEKIELQLHSLDQTELELDDLRLDPALIQAACKAAGKPITSETANKLHLLPDFLDKLFGPNLSVDEMLKRNEAWKRHFILAALDNAGTSGIHERYRLAEKAHNMLPGEHPRAAEITELKNRLGQQIEKEQALLKEQSENDPEERKKTAKCETGTHRDISCSLAETAGEGKKSAYAILAQEGQIVTAADVNRAIRKLGRYGRKSQDRFPVDGLEMGTDYVLRQDGDRLVRIITDNRSLKNYLAGCGDNIVIPVRKRPAGSRCPASQNTLHPLPILG